MLKVHLLGKTSFQITQNSEAIFRKSLRLRILGFLILNRDPVSRKRLSRIFWPHLNDQDARTYLRNILARLKEDFSPWIEVTRDSICFKTDSDCWVDIYELEKILNQYKELNFRDLEYAQVNEFKTGLDLYKGSFMEDLTKSISPWFDEWISSEREYLLKQVLEGYEKLVAYRIEKQDWDVAIEEAGKMVTLNPKYENGWYLLMRSLANSGDLRRAQEAYERFEKSPSNKLKVSKTQQEMNLLYRRIGQKISGINLNLDSFDPPQDQGLSFD